MDLIEKNGLKINSKIFEFINDEVIPGTNIKSEDFWIKFENVVHELAPINKKLIEKREIIQKKIDEWHKNHKGKNLDKKEYIKFLKAISYIVEEKEDFKIETSEVDKEISSIAGPQLVVPVDNARYALNAANARWGSLYNALYGTDVIPGDKGKGYNEQRGKKVIDYVRNFLDESAPIANFSWKDISNIDEKKEKVDNENNTNNTTKEKLVGTRIDDKTLKTSLSNQIKNQLKNTNQIKTSPIKDLNNDDQKSKIEITSFQDLINQANKEKEIELKYDLERNVKLVSFNKGSIDISFNEKLNRNFIKSLTEKLLLWTGERWIISLSKNINAKSLHEKNLEDKSNMMEEFKKSKIAQDIQKAIPDAKLIDLKEEE